jgi:uncharacterized protein (TIGR02118 family)
MIKVTFLYPKTEGSRFDLGYYLTKHLDLSRDAFGAVLRGIEIDQGLSGIEPGSPSPYHVAAHLMFDCVEDFYTALMPRVEELRADVANYFDGEAIIQISEPIELERPAP